MKFENKRKRQIIKKGNILLINKKKNQKNILKKRKEKRVLKNIYY